MSVVRAVRIAPLFFALVVAACAGIRVSQDYDPATDFSTLGSFDWQPGEQPSSGSLHLDSQLVDRRVRDAVERTLVKKGYRKIDDAAPDFFVSYFFSVGTRLDGSGIDYRAGTYGRHGGVSVGTSNRVREIDEATLAIDVLEPSSRDLLWRGTSTRRLRQGPTPEQTTASIDETVAAILEQFPPR